MHNFNSRKHYPVGQFHLNKHCIKWLQGNHKMYSFQINPVKPYALYPIPSTDQTLTCYVIKV